MTGLYARIFACLFLIASVIGIAGCKDKTTKQIPPMEIPVMQVVTLDVPVTLEFVGQTYGEYDIPIRARVDGYLEGMHFKEGFAVKKGQLLYTIDAQPYEADVAAKMSDVAQAKTMLVNAESYKHRIQPLAKMKAVSESDLDDAIAQYDAAKAAVDAANANLELSKIQLGYTKIKAPIDGIIGKTKAKVGEYVGKDPNPVILNTVSDIENINVDFYLNENQYLTIAKRSIGKERQEGKEQNYLELILADGSVFDHKGKVDFIDRQVDASTGSILIQASFPNPDKLVRPGQFAKVRVTFDTLRNAMLIPQRAITDIQGEQYVYLVSDSNKVKMTKIITGILYKDLQVVREGLKKSDKYIYMGFEKVKDEMAIKPKIVEYISPDKEQKSN
jgi:membrane fusion protein (multidrug efflux system)